jgi:DNA-binding MarR family transcriptional regulator
MIAVKATGEFQPSRAADLHIAALLGLLFEQVRRMLAEEDWGGLRPSHFRLLEAVPAAGISITALAPALRMTKQAVGQFVTQLVASGHLEVQVATDDRRRRVVTRTSTGDETVAALAARLERLEREWAQQVGTRRYEGFRATLELLAEQ